MLVKEIQKFNIPIEFEQVANVVDDRFMKVKVWIAHTGENRNNSIFSKEVLESMIPSLANIPILGYIDKNNVDEKDFRGHEERLSVENGKFKINYVGRAYGLIPTENNARFELRYGEDGVEREYLVCDGLIWRKFPEVEEIFDRDNGFKWQSMELQHSSVEGYLNENGVFVFTKAKFEGACILGEDVTPAMVSSTIEKFSIGDSIQSELKEMLAEFNAHFSETKEKGDDNVPPIENEQVKVNEEEEVEQTEFTENKENEVPVVEEPLNENPANFVEDEEEEEEKEVKEDGEEEEDEEEEEKAKFTRTFELSHDDIRTGIYKALYEHPEFENKWMWISKVFDNHAIIEDEDSGKYYKVNYVKHENAVSLGEYEEVFPMFVNAEEKTALEIARTSLDALKEEVETLREFKANIETAEKEQVLSQYTSVLSKEEFESIKGSLDKFSCEDIEKEVGFMLLKKNKFSTQNVESEETRVNAVNAVKTNPYGSLSAYFTAK